MNGSQQQQQQPPNHSVSHPPSLYMCTPTFIDPVSCHHIHLYPYALAHHVMLIVYQSTSSCFVLSTQIMCCSVSPIRPAPDGQPGPPPPSFLHSGRVVEEMPRDTPPSHTHTHIHTYTHTHILVISRRAIAQRSLWTAAYGNDQVRCECRADMACADAEHLV